MEIACKLLRTIITIRLIADETYAAMKIYKFK
jgi:hypothetical protein